METICYSTTTQSWSRIAAIVSSSNLSISFCAPRTWIQSSLTRYCLSQREDIELYDRNILAGKSLVYLPLPTHASMCTFGGQVEKWFLLRYFNIYSTCVACKIVLSRETGDWRGVAWPLLTVKRRQMGLKEYKWKGSFLGWFIGLVVPLQEIFILPWLLLSVLYKIFFSSPYTIFTHLSPSSSNPCRQLCCILICVSGSIQLFLSRSFTH